MSCTVACSRTSVWQTNPVMGTLKPQSNGPLYSNRVIGTLAVDGWAVTLLQRGGAGRAAALSSLLLAVSNVTAHPSTARVSTSYYLRWQVPLQSKWLRPRIETRTVRGSAIRILADCSPQMDRSARLSHLHEA